MAMNDIYVNHVQHKWSNREKRRLMSLSTSQSSESTESTESTAIPSASPTINPSQYPSQNPSQYPSQYPSRNPSQYPSRNPSQYPSRNPTEQCAIHDDCGTEFCCTQDAGCMCHAVPCNDNDFDGRRRLQSAPDLGMGGSCTTPMGDDSALLAGKMFDKEIYDYNIQNINNNNNKTKEFEVSLSLDQSSTLQIVVFILIFTLIMNGICCLFKKKIKKEKNYHQYQLLKQLKWMKMKFIYRFIHSFST